MGETKRKKVVVATGVFDILHPGHVRYLEEAKKLGDELVVIVATDKTAEKLKHRPIMNQEIRRKMVESLKPVDRAVIGHEDDMFRIIEEIRPAVIALGYDQKFDEDWIRRECYKRGLEVEVVRIPKFDGDLNGTRKIIFEIVERFNEKVGGRNENCRNG